MVTRARETVLSGGLNSCSLLQSGWRSIAQNIEDARVPGPRRSPGARWGRETRHGLSANPSGCEAAGSPARRHSGGGAGCRGRRRHGRGTDRTGSGPGQRRGRYRLSLFPVQGRADFRVDCRGFARRTGGDPACGGCRARSVIGARGGRHHGRRPRAVAAQALLGHSRRAGRCPCRRDSSPPACGCRGGCPGS